MPNLENIIIWPYGDMLKAVQHILIWFSTRQIHSLKNKEDQRLIFDPINTFFGGKYKIKVQIFHKNDNKSCRQDVVRIDKFPEKSYKPRSFLRSFMEFLMCTSPKTDEYYSMSLCISHIFHNFT